MRDRCQRPPMGWNSYDAFGSSVTEAQLMENLDAFDRKLKAFGWELFVVDFGWSHPNPGAVENPDQMIAPDGSRHPQLAMDRHGRLLPAIERFPSAKDGGGFSGLAEEVHRRGLKFGLHMMRGIPAQALGRGFLVEGTKTLLDSIALPDNYCAWNNQMVGVDAAHPDAQAYYDSLIRLYAGWGVDFIKADDFSYLAPYPALDPALGDYAAVEIELLARAVARVDRPIVLSLSPGPAAVENAAHLRKHANLWRISADFWDDWEALKRQFYYCRIWNAYRSEGAWPDADMIPFGALSLCGPKGAPRKSRFNEAEKETLMALWAIFRSPLMLGGHLPEIDKHSLGLLTNPNLLRINQHTRNNRELRVRRDEIIWTAEDEEYPCHYLALFNLGNHPRRIGFDPAELSGINWDNAVYENILGGSPPTIEDGYPGFEISPHGVRLLCIEKERTRLKKPERNKDNEPHKKNHDPALATVGGLDPGMAATATLCPSGWSQRMESDI